MTRTNRLSATLAAAAAFIRRNRRWRIAGLLSLIIIVDLLARANVSIALPTIRHDLRLSNTQMGLIFSTFQLAYALSHVPLGLTVDRFGARRVILIGGLFWVIFAAGSGVVTSFGMLLVMRACLGLAESPVFPAGIKVVNYWFPNREKAKAVAMYEVAVQLGFALAPLLGALILVRIGWRLMFVSMAGLSLIPLAIWFLFFRAPEEDVHLTPEEKALILTDRQLDATETPSLAEWLGLFRNIQPWAMVAAGTCTAIMSGYYLWLPIYFQETRHFSIVKAGSSMSLFGVAGIFGVILGAFLSDHLVSRGATVLAARLRVIVGSLLLVTLLTALTAIPQGNAAMIGIICVSYFVTGLGTAAGWTLVPAIAPNARLVASLGSLQNGGWQLGQAIAPLAIGFLIDRHFDFHAIIIGSAGFGILSVAIYLTALRRPIEPTPPGPDQIYAQPAVAGQ